MKTILRRKAKLIVALIILIVLVLALCIVYESIFANNNSKYGNRLDGIEQVSIKVKQKNEIKKNVETLEMSSSVKVSLTGKILEVMIDVKDDTSLDKAKESYGKVMEKLSDEQKKYFDVQIFLNKKDKDQSFPSIGYKHHNRENISWSKVG